MSQLSTPIPPRSALIASTRDWASLDEVALAMSVATEYETNLYIQRLGDRYRWSLIHRGGPYPLLRITARFLQVDYHSIIVGCSDLGEGWCGLIPDDTKPEADAVLTFDGPTTAHQIGELSRQVLAVFDS